MKYVAVAVESGSISRAATALNVSQPSVTRQIRALERELETALLTRTSRGVSATRAGAALIRQYERITTEMRRIPDVVHAANNGQELVRFALSPGLPSEWLRSLFHRLTDTRPRLEPILVDLPSPDIDEAIKRRTVDIGFMHYSPPGLRSVRLFEQDLGIAIRPESRHFGHAETYENLGGALLLAHGSWEVSGRMNDERDLKTILGPNTTIRYRRFTEHVGIFCEAMQADGVVLTEATALTQLTGWRWVPLSTDATAPIRITTYAVCAPPLNARMRALLDDVLAHSSEEHHG